MTQITIKKTHLYIVVGLISAIILLSVSFLFSSTSLQFTTLTENANVATLGLEVGNLAPDFRLTDSKGRSFSRNTLAGKPAIIIFTTTWCVPCQIGARELLKYDLETGDDAFNVVVIFIDPSETNEQVKNWKNKFGGADWLTALDTTGVAYAYEVKFLDTKYVLNKNGIIVWKDFYPLNYETIKRVLAPLI